MPSLAAGMLGALSAGGGVSLTSSPNDAPREGPGLGRHRRFAAETTALPHPPPGAPAHGVLEPRWQHRVVIM